MLQVNYLIENYTFSSFYTSLFQEKNPATKSTYLALTIEQKKKERENEAKKLTPHFHLGTFPVRNGEPKTSSYLLIKQILRR